MCLAFVLLICILCTFEVIYINFTQFLFYGSEYCTCWYSSFSSTTLCEFWLAELFLSIASSPASFVSNWSLPSSSNHSSHCLPISLLAFPSVLLHTVSICIWSWPLFHWSFFLHAPTSSVICILCILLYFLY